MSKEEGHGWTIYCLRDRMMDYYMQPFAAADDKAVMSAVARIINTPGSNNDPVAQAPHHFEIWKLCNITELGNTYQAKEFVADCATLVRPGRQSTEQGTSPLREPAQRQPGTLEAPRGNTDAQERSSQGKAQASHRVRAKKAKGAPRAPKR